MGKTTLLRIILGLQRPDSGEVRCSGRRCPATALPRLRAPEGGPRPRCAHAGPRPGGPRPGRPPLRLRAPHEAATRTGRQDAPRRRRRAVRRQPGGKPLGRRAAAGPDRPRADQPAEAAPPRRAAGQSRPEERPGDRRPAPPGGQRPRRGHPAVRARDERPAAGDGPDRLPDRGPGGQWDHRGGRPVRRPQQALRPPRRRAEAPWPGAGGRRARCRGRRHPRPPAPHRVLRPRAPPLRARLLLERTGPHGAGDRGDDRPRLGRRRRVHRGPEPVLRRPRADRRRHHRRIGRLLLRPQPAGRLHRRRDRRRGRHGAHRRPAGAEPGPGHRHRARRGDRSGRPVPLSRHDDERHHRGHPADPVRIDLHCRAVHRSHRHRPECGHTGLVAAIHRPLLLSSVSPDLASARGIGLRTVGLLFMLALAVSVGLSSIAIGSILSTALLIGPPATALRVTRSMRPRWSPPASSAS